MCIHKLKITCCLLNLTIFPNWPPCMVHSFTVLSINHEFTGVVITRFHLSDVMPAVDHVTRSLCDSSNTGSEELCVLAFLTEAESSSYRTGYGNWWIHCVKMKRKNQITSAKLAIKIKWNLLYNITNYIKFYWLFLLN